MSMSIFHIICMTKNTEWGDRFVKNGPVWHQIVGWIRHNHRQGWALSLSILSKYQLTNAGPHAWLQLQQIISSTSNTICTFHSHRCVSTDGSTKWKNSLFIWSPLYILYFLSYSILLFWLHMYGEVCVSNPYSDVRRVELPRLSSISFVTYLTLQQV